MELSKTRVAGSFLTRRTVVAATPGDHNSFDGSLADQAWLAFAAVHPVLQLEESFLAIGTHVVRDRRPSQCDGFVQYLPQGGVQLPQLLAGERPCPALGTNACAKQ